MSKQGELVKNTLILGFGKLAAQVSTFALLPIYTIFLSPDEFGVVDLIVSYVALLAPLLMIQLDRAAFRYLIEARGDDVRSRAVVSNTLYIVVPTLVLVGLAYACVAAAVTIPYAPLIAASVVATVFSALSLQLARGLARNDLYALGSIVLGISNLAVSAVLVAGLKMGAEGVLWGLAIANTLTAVVVATGLRLHRYVALDGSASDVAMCKDLIGFAWPLVPSAVSWWFIRTFDRTLVTVIVGVTANGVYAAANKYAAIFTALYGIFDLSWTESASAHINSKGRDKFFSSVYNSSFRFFTAIGIGLIAVTPFVFGFLIGEEFTDARKYIPILVLGAFLNAVVSQYSVVYIAKKLTREVLITSIAAAAISVLMNLILINLIGVMGAALALVASFATMAIWRHHDIKKYVTITFDNWLFIKLGAAFAFTISLYYVDNLYLNIFNLVATIGVAFVLSKKTVMGGAGGVLAKLAARRKSPRG